MYTVKGQGHSQLVPDDLMAKKIALTVFDKQLDRSLTPNIALANAEFEGDLVCGSKVRFFGRDLINESIFQTVQGNEEPEVSVIELCAHEVEICGQKKFHIKLSVDQIRKLQCEGLDSIYFQTIEDTISTTLDKMWDESHLAHMVMMAGVTGNNALGMVNLGSPDNPIVIPQERQAAADALEAIYTDLNLVMTKQNIMDSQGGIALVLPAQVANRSLNVFRDLNVCCGDQNVRINGNLPKTIYGFDPFQTNRNVLTVRHNGRIIQYIIAADKYASGFVSDMYNFKWYEGKFDWFLVGTEVHGSYVTMADHIAVAVVTFA